MTNTSKKMNLVGLTLPALLLITPILSTTPRYLIASQTTTIKRKLSPKRIKPPLAGPGLTQVTQPRCRIRDSYNFRDIFIKPNSEMARTSYYLQDITEEIYISLCRPLPDSLFSLYNCSSKVYSPNKDYFFAKFEMKFDIKRHKIVPVCVSFLEKSEITRFSYKSSSSQYSLIFHDESLDEFNEIIFPFPEQQNAVKYVYSSNDFNQFMLRGKPGNMVVEDGYVLSGLSFELQFAFNLLVSVYTFRFSIMAGEGEVDRSFFVCGKDVEFFRQFLNLSVFYETLNAVFQLYANPVCLLATYLVTLFPLHVGLSIPRAVTFRIFICKIFELKLPKFSIFGSF